ncbi:cytochrome b [Stakelama marina]|uniref:Cytochrome b n=1 Tax=Stakelama marina TaxID=2826939 RepID=A0A8T4IH50_9SPHN|nr:cytochrome b [Stakelama marina]MBR0552395.1 cytochrome b [Stakelama marina]
MSSATDRTDRYNRGAIAFHWTIALLVIVNIIIGLFHESLFDPRQVMPLHKSIGMLVLVLSVGRLVWRLIHPAPPLPSHVSKWEGKTSRTVQVIFYVLMIGMPLSGWFMASGARNPQPINWFGLFDIPLLPVGKSIAGASHEFHELAGYLFAALVVLHIAGALRHHFILRDRVLDRMLGRTATGN